MDELLKQLNAEREALKTKSGAHCIFSENGPVSLGLVEKIVAVLQQQDRTIAVLKQQIADMELH